MNSQMESQAEASQPRALTDANTDIPTDSPTTNDTAAASARGNAHGPLPVLLDILFLENCGRDMKRGRPNHHFPSRERRSSLVFLALYTAITATLVVMVWVVNKT
ncbi:hypothetical protein B0I37DRAFT_418465 [Chaetomium sp. MPI-CAGE-AT-0009]|nr:hypothetical protein B0I37DRAFT_418465 [Chaetomium sp. MPI-CAGE-AT-0009]